MKQTEAECLVVTSEECAELTKECMLDLLGDHLNISSDDVLEASIAKRKKLKKYSNLIGDK